ncbi:MAG: hypothetical protein DHS20C15_23230 [Planctomycetota bacterium]|nr:MAG: hypothetical protein DHS20C15_23230 [Planctomycetota bacterium]
MVANLLVSTRKGLFEFERGSDGWAVCDTHFLGDNVTLALHDPRDGSDYAALNHGHFGVKLHRRDKGGAWQEIATPEYPEKPAASSEVNPMSQQEREWKLSLVWALETGGANEPGVIWCGTLPGALFKSSDRGDSWQIVESLWNHELRQGWFGGGADEPGVHSVCVDPRDSAHVTVAVSCGGVWRTRDGGDNWELCAQGMRAEYMPPDEAYDQNTQDPHHMELCPGAPDNFWVQHHNGIFRSVDDSATWTEIEEAGPSVFGFGVAVHPRDPDTAWFVPGVNDQKRHAVAGQVVVTRTRDGGKSFDVLRDGLPQSNAYDLALRHALDIDSSGDVLAFGSTTGNLWLSENQGDAWSTLANHLPPIYAVRFRE